MYVVTHTNIIDLYRICPLFPLAGNIARNNISKDQTYDSRIFCESSNDLR